MSNLRRVLPAPNATVCGICFLSIKASLEVSKLLGLSLAEALKQHCRRHKLSQVQRVKRHYRTMLSAIQC